MILKDRVAIVTGARLGIGRPIALGLAGEGAHVVVNDLKGEETTGELISQIQKSFFSLPHYWGASKER